MKARKGTACIQAGNGLIINGVLLRCVVVKEVDGVITLAIHGTTGYYKYLFMQWLRSLW